MLKLPEIPNPVSLGFSSYSMTTLGKILLGGLAAQAVISMAQSSQQYVPEYETQEQYNRAWFYNFLTEFSNFLEDNQAEKNAWRNLPREQKKFRLVRHLAQQNRYEMVQYVNEFFDANPEPEVAPQTYDMEDCVYRPQLTPLSETEQAALYARLEATFKGAHPKK